MLPEEDFIDQAPIGIGEQVHVNHENCTAGIDTKKRLYIKRKSNGNVIAYCHNCGDNGWSSDGNVPKNIHTYSKATDLVVEDLRYPPDYTTDLDMWSPQAKAWVYRYGITDAEISAYRIGYTLSNNRILLPVHETELLRYQTRRIVDDGTPKYLTAQKKDVDKRLTSCWDTRTATHSDVCVITEDLLSAIKCGRLLLSVPLMGTHITDADLLHIARCNTKVFIYLDNDNHQVKADQEDLRRRLLLLGVEEVVVVRENKDPKECTMKQLEEIFK